MSNKKLKVHSTKIVLLTMVFMMLISMNIPVIACSSFALYGDVVLYGMNWDYYTDHDAIFTVDDADGMKVFKLIDANEGFSPVGMNSEGVFCSMQNVYPEESFDPHDSKLANISMKDLFKQALYECGSLEEAKEYLADKRLNYSMVQLHDMIADSKGNAMIAEAGRKSNMYTELQGDFLVMTNFSNYYFKDKKYNEIYAQTSDRYITAHDYILKNKDSFDIDKGFRLLQNIVWTGTYTTRCSFVFDPNDKAVYIAADRDFEKLWKVSLENETIETYKGFEKPMKLLVKGLRLSDMKKLADYDQKTIKKLENKFITYTGSGQQAAIRPSAADAGKVPLNMGLWLIIAAAALILTPTAIVLKKRHK